MKYLFLDIDGVLNTGQYSNHLVDNGLCETDADGYFLFSAMGCPKSLVRVSGRWHPIAS